MRRPERDEAPAALKPTVDRLFRAAYALCDSGAEAEGLVLETFARAAEDPRLVRRGSELAYLTQVMRDAWVDRRRAASPRPTPVGPVERVEWVADRDEGGGEFALDVRLAYHATRDLPPPLREAVVAVDIIGLAHRDAARALRIRPRALMSRLTRGRERIAAALEGTTINEQTVPDRRAEANAPTRLDRATVLAHSAMLGLGFAFLGAVAGAILLD